jgi:hypothetical protein
VQRLLDVLQGGALLPDFGFNICQPGHQGLEQGIGLCFVVHTIHPWFMPNSDALLA